MVNRSSSAKEAETEKIPQAEVVVCIKKLLGEDILLSKKGVYFIVEWQN